MKLITLDELDEKNSKQLRYFKKYLKGSSTPKPLFNSNGEFNDDNWNSGEASIIRNVMREIESNGGYGTRKESELFYPAADISVSARVILHHTWMDDYQYLTILVDGDVTSCDNQEQQYFTDQYAVKVYKSRGAITSLLKNGIPITRNEYLSLLHILQSAKLIKGDD